MAAGAAATGCGVALLAVSGFLLARASQHPGILAISAAVVAVRALSAGRGVSRYLERLASHDAAFRVLARVRVRIYRRLERLAPAGLAEFSSGDLLARLVSDVDATQDLFIRGIAARRGRGRRGVGRRLPADPRARRGRARRPAAGGRDRCPGARGQGGARRGQACEPPARGQLAASLTDLMAGAAELHAYGARETALASVTVADADLTRQADRNAMVSGLSAGLSSVAGLTVWGVLLLGVAATGGGALTRVPLAVLTLTALASFEAVTALPAAAVQLGHARVSARRIAALLDAPDPVREPLAPRPLPDGPISVRLRGAQVRYRPDGPAALDGIDLDLLPGRRVALTGADRRGEVHAGQRAALGSPSAARARVRAQRPRPGRLRPADEVLARPGSAAAPPDPHIFDASLRDNLRLARPAGQRRAELAGGRGPGPAAGLDRVAAPALGHPGRRPRGHAVRRPAPAAGRSPGPARRSGSADTR